MAAAKALSQSALAKIWGCTQPAISKLVAAGMPLTSAAAARNWKEEQQERAGRTGLSDDERAIRLDLLRIERDQKQFNLDKARESQLPVAQFERALAKTLAAFLQQLNAFGPRVNENLEGLEFDERADVIEREVELLRKRNGPTQRHRPRDRRQSLSRPARFQPDPDVARPPPPPRAAPRSLLQSLQSARTGGSLFFGIVPVLHKIATRPGPILWLDPTTKTAAGFPARRSSPSSKRAAPRTRSASATGNRGPRSR
jgi:hypothetical protein